MDKIKYAGVFPLGIKIQFYIDDKINIKSKHIITNNFLFPAPLGHYVNN